MNPESKRLLPSLVTVCVTVSLFTQVTVFPTFTVKFAGEKNGPPGKCEDAPSTIVTSAPVPELASNRDSTPAARIPIDAAPTMKPRARTASVVDTGTVFGGVVGGVLRQATRTFRIENTNTRTSTEAKVTVWRKIGTSANPVRPSPRSPEKRTRNATLMTAAAT